MCARLLFGCFAVGESACRARLQEGVLHLIRGLFQGLQILDRTRRDFFECFLKGFLDSILDEVGTIEAIFPGRFSLEQGGVLLCR